MLEEIQINRPDAAEVDINLIRTYAPIEQLGNCLKKYGPLIKPVS
nr:hypothetical protein [Phyllobacterium salinisoli]